jgi:ABC-type Na+ efflux pump permease subunit
MKVGKEEIIGALAAVEAKTSSKALERPRYLMGVGSPEDLVEGIEVVGSLSPKFTADVKSEYAGIVTEVYVTEWVRVKKGTPLAKIDTREIEIVLQKAKAAVEMAKANLYGYEFRRISPENVDKAAFGKLDFVFIIQMVASLIVLLFASDLIAGEKEMGTLRAILSNSVPRHTILLGKLAGGFLTVWIPFVTTFVLGMVFLGLLAFPLDRGEIPAKCSYFSVPSG